MDDEEPAYSEVLEHLFGLALREGLYQAPNVSTMSPELAVAAFIRAWRAYRTDQIIGADELEIGLALANGAPAAELTEERTIGEAHLRGVVDPPAPQPQPRRGLFRAE
jgi:hypothetical protein